MEYDDPSIDDDTLVTLFETRNLMRADMIRAQLEVEGIDVLIPNETMWASGHPASWRSSLQVQVPASQLRQALAILNEFAERAEEEEPSDIGDDEVDWDDDDDAEDPEGLMAEEPPPSREKRAETRLHLLILLGPPGLWLLFELWRLLKNLFHG